MAKELKYHKAADLFPLMVGDDFAALRKSIQKKGLQKPIEMLDGKVIDGRNRYRACRAEKKQAKTVKVNLNGLTPLEYVLVANLERRHLTASERAMVAARSVDMFKEQAKERQKAGQRKGGGDRRSAKAKTASGGKKPKAIEGNGKAVTEAGEALGVSGDTVRKAKKVQDEGARAIQKAVEQGDVSVNLAAKFVKTCPDKTRQAEIVKKGPDAVKAAVKPKGKASAGLSVPDWFLESLSLVDGTLDAIREEHGGMVAMFRSKAFKPRIKECAAVLKATTNELVSANKEAQAYAQKQK